jgi:hypothetical protein
MQGFEESLEIREMDMRRIAPRHEARMARRSAAIFRSAIESCGCF